MLDRVQDHDLAHLHPGQVVPLAGHRHRLAGGEIQDHAVERHLVLLGGPLAERRLDRQLDEDQPVALDVRGGLADREALALVGAVVSQGRAGVGGGELQARGLRAQAEPRLRGLGRGQKPEHGELSGRQLEHHPPIAREPGYRSLEEAIGVLVVRRRAGGRAADLERSPPDGQPAVPGVEGPLHGRREARVGRRVVAEEPQPGPEREGAGRAGRELRLRLRIVVSAEDVAHRVAGAPPLGGEPGRQLVVRPRLAHDLLVHGLRVERHVLNAGLRHRHTGQRVTGRGRRRRVELHPRAVQVVLLRDPQHRPDEGPGRGAVDPAAGQQDDVAAPEIRRSAGDIDRVDLEPLDSARRRHRAGGVERLGLGSVERGGAGVEPDAQAQEIQRGAVDRQLLRPHLPRPERVPLKPRGDVRAGLERLRQLVLAGHALHLGARGDDGARR